jgi:hypothetical protein
LDYQYPWAHCSRAPELRIDPLGLGLEPGYGATVKGQQIRGAEGGTDNNLKHRRQPNDRMPHLKLRPKKGGPETRGTSCRIHIDNCTPWYVDIYTDGNYRGQMSLWGDSYGWVGCGDTNLSGVAAFRDGSNIFGPTVYGVNETFTWSPYPLEIALPVRQPKGHGFTRALACFGDMIRA